MNNETHKIFGAIYKHYEYYAIPIDWNDEDITIRYGTLYYKGKEQNVPKKETECDSKYPDEMGTNEEDVETWFDCEEHPKCIDCDNLATKNEWFGDNSEGGKYWKLCEDCFKKDSE